ncbi:MAG: hypothetical protein ACFFCC_01425 [Promethearchaeota archaeon]
MNFIKSLRSKHIKIRSDVHEVLDFLKKFVPDTLKDEWEKFSTNHTIYRNILKTIKLRFVLEDVDCYEVNDKLGKCISVMQKLYRDAKNSNQVKLNKKDKRRIRIVIGALNDLQVYINPETKEFESLSDDMAHIQKTTHAIQHNIAVLYSLEAKVRGETDSQLEKALQMFSNLNKQDQNYIVEEVFSSFFSEEWMTLLPTDKREASIHYLLTKKNATEFVRPYVAVDFVLRYDLEKRREFFKALKPKLTGHDLEILFGKESKEE